MTRENLYLVVYGGSVSVFDFMAPLMILSEASIQDLNSKLSNNKSNDKQPKYLLMEPLLPNDKKIQIPNLISGLVPIFPIEKQFPFIEKGLGKSITIKWVQLPLTSAFCLTVHKAQGKTFDKVKVDLQRPVSGKI